MLRSTLAATILAVSSSALAADIEVGKPLPIGVLPDITDGAPRSLAAFRGRKVMLHVFASW